MCCWRPWLLYSLLIVEFSPRSASCDQVSDLTNVSIVATCSRLVACWQQQPDCQGGLYVDSFGYQLTNGTSVVEGGDVTNTCVSFNLSTTIPNVDGYMLSIWGQASPGNGPPTTLQAIAATDPVVKYDYDVAIVKVNGQERAVLLLAGTVNHGSCPTEDPTMVLLYFSCGSDLPAVRPLPVCIASSNTTEVIQSDPVEAGHRNCYVKVISKNLSGKTVNDSHTFDTTDVQMFNARPLNGADNLGAINCSMMVAMNSSILEFMVDITGSSGRRFGAHVTRTIDQRVVSGTTMMLPVDIYTLTLSVLTSSGFQYSEFTKIVNITRSNYSTTTSTPTPSPALPTPTPGNNWIIAVAVVVVLLVVLGTSGLIFIVVCCYFIINKHKSSHHDRVTLRRDPCGSHDVVISEKEEVDHDVTNGTYENLANAPTNPTNTRDTTLQSTAAVQSSQDSSSVQIPSPPSSPKPEEAVADPTQNPLTSTQTLPSDYKSDNVVVGFDSSYEVIPSELSTTANSEQALLSSPPPVHLYHHPKQIANHPVQETTTNTNTADSAQALLSQYESTSVPEHPIQATTDSATAAMVCVPIPLKSVLMEQPAAATASSLISRFSDHGRSKRLTSLPSVPTNPKPVATHSTQQLTATVDSERKFLADNEEDSFFTDTEKETDDPTINSQTVASKYTV